MQTFISAITPLAKEAIQSSAAPAALGDRAERTWAFQTFVAVLVANGSLIFSKSKPTVENELVNLIQTAVGDTRLVFQVEDTPKSPEELVLEEVRKAQFFRHRQLPIFNYGRIEIFKFFASSFFH
jgi:hypothetical protein